jgi:hypothetical protein
MPRTTILDDGAHQSPTLISAQRRARRASKPKATAGDMPSRRALVICAAT